MQAYKAIIGEESTLVLSTDGDLFKFLKGMSPARGVGAAGSR
jgi:membrane protease subunit HflC